jgi:hypothetical protein
LVSLPAVPLAVKVFLNSAVGIIGKLVAVLWTVSENSLKTWQNETKQNKKPPWRVVAKGAVQQTIVKDC